MGYESSPWESMVKYGGRCSPAGNFRVAMANIFAHIGEGRKIVLYLPGTFLHVLWEKIYGPMGAADDR